MRRWLDLTVSLALAGLALLLAVLAFDRLTLEEPDHSPVVATSALDGWRAPWGATAGAVTTSCPTLPRRWLMIGWDGADWDLVLPLIESGRLPNLERLMRGGAYGTLHSMVPTLSPAIWTTVATGVSPEHHGITHFYNQQPRLARWLDRVRHFGRLDRQLFTNADRRAEAIWNLLSERDRRVVRWPKLKPV